MKISQKVHRLTKILSELNEVYFSTDLPVIDTLLQWVSRNPFSARGLADMPDYPRCSSGLEETGEHAAVSPCPFPTTVIITPEALDLPLSVQEHKKSCNIIH